MAAKDSLAPVVEEAIVIFAKEGDECPASDLPGEWNDCESQMPQDKTEPLRAAFEQGIWNQHLRDQANSAAPVQGVRFFYAPTTPEATQTHSNVEEKLLLGHFGYVTLLPETVHVDDTTGDLKLSLGQLKTWLQNKKAWEANRKAFAALVGKIVPVIHMQRGRPKDKRFGGNDTLLGTFLLSEEDANMLSCVLSPRPWGNSASGGLDATTIKHVSNAFLTNGKGVKKRRRELPVYTPTGCLLGWEGFFGSNGVACKDIWITHIQKAQTSIRINAYCISDPDILEELRKAAAPARGVAVRIRYDARQQSKTQQGIFEEDRMRHVSVHPVEVSADERVIMHKKELIIDCEVSSHEDGGFTCNQKLPEFLVLGSYNPTSNAKGNQESVVVITGTETVRACAVRFDQDWEQETRNYERELSGGSGPVEL